MAINQVIEARTLSTGYEKGHPLHVSTETQAVLQNNYEEKIYEFYDLCEPKAWKDMATLLFTCKKERALELLQKKKDPSFIVFGLQHLEIKQVDLCLEAWEKVLKANEHNQEMTWKQIFELEQNFNQKEVYVALGMRFATFQLLFNFAIPHELEKMLTDLLNKSFSDPTKENELLDPARANELSSARAIQKLYVSFKERFNRLPNKRIFSTMISSIDILNVNLLADRFNVKSMRYALGLTEEIGGTEFHPMYLSLLFGNKVQCIVEKLKKNNCDMYGFISGMPLHVPVKDEQLIQWLVSRVGTTKTEVIHDVCKFWEKSIFPKNGTIKEMIAFLSKNRAEKEWELCKGKYPDVFNKPFQCFLKDQTYESGEERVRLLDANDKLQVLIGSLTVCCQQLNHSGEPSMIEGLLNPYSGFLVFERGNKILAQAWIWLSEDGTQLVLDNIELADNRKPEAILHLLYHWAKQSSYSNISMGCDYNKVKIGIPVKDEDKKWYKKHWKYEYTDADNRVWLKRENKMTISWSEKDD